MYSKMLYEILTNTIPQYVLPQSVTDSTADVQVDQQTIPLMALSISSTLLIF